ncbi:hypothetical protein QYG89_07850 [Bacillus sp. B190/17]|uniref:Group-specific protein n=1 Tax=Bacillus lumedeiriae TaxID=3058829 RepID=A0ABW8I8S0_9BACI
MFSSLSQGIKISITRSIKTSFEQYMAKIMWDEKVYRFEDFFNEWKTYIHTSASWYDKVSEEIKSSPEFHEELAEKINEVVERVLSEEPTSDQLEELEALQKEAGTDFDFSCRMEAKFYIDFLSEQLKKKKSN